MAITDISGYTSSQAAITGINGYKNESTDVTARTPNNELGKDEFLQILAYQLANQDPLEPMKDTDFIAQMAQFSSLEQMQALNTQFTDFMASMNKANAYSLIGKDVYAEVSGINGSSETQYIYGRVQGVSRHDGVDYLQVGDYMIPLSAVHEVFDNGQANDALLIQSSSMIGKTVEAKVPVMDGTEYVKDADGNIKYETISGIVKEIVVQDGKINARIDVDGTDKDVPVSYINRIS